MTIGVGFAMTFCESSFVTICVGLMMNLDVRDEILSGRELEVGACPRALNGLCG